MVCLPPISPLAAAAGLSLALAGFLLKLCWPLAALLLPFRYLPSQQQPPQPPQQQATYIPFSTAATMAAPLGFGALSDGGGGPTNDPTLPMARMYLRLLAESQQEAAMAKQRLWELRHVMAQQQAEWASHQHEPSTGTNPAPDEHDHQTQPSSGHEEGAGQPTPAGAAAGAVPVPPAVPIPGLAPAGLGGFAPAMMAGLDTHSFGAAGYGGAANLGGRPALMPTLGVPGIDRLGVAGADLGMQFLARQALMRKQYDFLRHQVDTMRANVDQVGRAPGGDYYTRVADTQREINDRRPPVMTMDEARRRVDEGLGPQGL